MIPRRSSLRTPSTLPSTPASQLKLPRSILSSLTHPSLNLSRMASNTWANIAGAPATPPKPRIAVVLNPPKPLTPAEKDFKQFTFFVRGTAAEFLNDIKKGSFEVLDDKWWKEQHEKIIDMIEKHELNNYGISSAFIKSLLAALPADLLNKKQKKAFTEYIMQAYIRYNAVVKDTCYCDDGLCMGDCGVLVCGCIDCCRCWRDDYDY